MRHYIARLREMLEMVRKLQTSGRSPAIEQQLADFEQELRQAATELTIQACKQAVNERRTGSDRRQSSGQRDIDRRVLPPRRRSSSVGMGTTDVEQ